MNGLHLTNASCCAFWNSHNLQLGRPFDPLPLWLLWNFPAPTLHPVACISVDLLSFHGCRWHYPSWVVNTCYSLCKWLVDTGFWYLSQTVPRILLVFVKSSLLRQPTFDSHLYPGNFLLSRILVARLLNSSNSSSFFPVFIILFPYVFYLGAWIVSWNSSPRWS